MILKEGGREGGREGEGEGGREEGCQNLIGFTAQTTCVIVSPDLALRTVLQCYRVASL